MKTAALFTIFLMGLMYGAAFSLCTLVTMGSLFYKRIKRPLLFPVLAGVLFGAAYVVMQLTLGALMPVVPLLLHTIAAFLLLTDRSRSSLLALVCAELFSGSMITSMLTAVFSVSGGWQRTFLQVTLMYFAGDIAAAAFILLLARLVRSEDREPVGTLQMLLLTGIAYAVTRLVNSSFTMSDYVPDVSPEAAIPSLLMLMSVTVLLLLSVKQQQAKRFREMNELSEKYMSAQAKHFEQSRDADTEMRMLRHDMKNHIAVMTGLYNSGKTDELGEYLRGLGGAFADTQAVNITGCEIADAVIAEKRSLAEARGEQLVTEGSLKGLNVPAVTLCTVLSNLLDNAIEAAASLPAPVISLTAKRSGSFYYIVIANPSERPADTSSDMPTTKPDGAGHGLGVKSARRAAEKCGGTLELSCRSTADGFVFEAEVILPAEV